ncbi:MAG TPA: glutamine--fructose-6-phosphate transaminase (isomerizing) [Dehalococcoidia bacterium]|nr:glutamine--fructose-6-phosphate transaminase (isomerizing) [Dehalococcoidia bacterium]
MCGIVGYVGPDEAVSVVLDGLSQLEYRGYDSAGIAVIDRRGALTTAKDAGKLANLRNKIPASLKATGAAIGHTRWATHGRASQLNAHPHTDCSGEIAIIHNGIVENHRELRLELESNGCSFRSQTDTEVIPHLIEAGIKDGLDLAAATAAALRRIEGAAAVLTMREQEPGVLVAARVANAGGVVIGYGSGEMLVASDLPAIAARSQSVVFLEDGEMACVTRHGATYTNLHGEPIEKEPQTLPSGSYVAGKGLYDHFMAKEIAEQPEAVLDTLRDAAQLEPPAVHLNDLNLSDSDIAAINRVVLIGMGTSFHSAQIGRIYIEQLAGLPAEADNASEYRYRRPVLDEHTLVVSIGQSGESVDTLAAMHEAKRRGAKLVTVCNTPGSQATRIAHGTVYMHCGPEVAVASTKTYLGSLTALYLLACYLGYKRGFIGGDHLLAALSDLARAPQIVGEALKTEPEVERVARRYRRARDFLFLGRGMQYTNAMEGALKLKEVSYIHAEGYPAGEMKHGPISLIDSRMPVVAIAVRDEHYPKMLNNIEEVRARDGIVIAIATQGNEDMLEHARDVIYVPDAPPLIQPLVVAIPMQLLAYHLAKLKGCDIDQPRNLAKVVTVE